MQLRNLLTANPQTANLQPANLQTANLQTANRKSATCDLAISHLPRLRQPPQPRPRLRRKNGSGIGREEGLVRRASSGEVARVALVNVSDEESCPLDEIRVGVPQGKLSEGG
jgi:hypothetical protein